MFTGAETVIFCHFDSAIACSLVRLLRGILVSVPPTSTTITLLSLIVVISLGLTVTSCVRISVGYPAHDVPSISIVVSGFFVLGSFCSSIG